MSDPRCRVCSGFGHVPAVEHAQGWYERNWRIMLDPTVPWAPCPRCTPQPGLAQLHDDLARLMMLRLREEVKQWQSWGSWQVGQIEGQRQIWRWHELACVAMHDAPRRWWLLSQHGVSTGLDDAHLALLLSEAGAPALPAMDDENAP